MPEKSGRYLISSSAWWSACSNKDAVGDLHEKELFQVVETALINDLPQQFIGWLCAVLFESRHVDIINKENHLFTTERSNFSSSLFGEFIFVEEDIEDVFGVGLGREVHGSVSILIKFCAAEEIGDNNGLTDTSFTRKETILFVLNQFVQDVLVLDCIAGWHKDVEVRSFRIIFKLSHQFCPVAELLLLEVNKVVKNLVFVWESRVKFEDFVLDMVAEFHSRVVFHIVIKIGTC